MTMPFFPACPPFGDFIAFVYDDRVDVIVNSHALTQLTAPAASLVDALAADVEQVGVTVWRFTYQLDIWPKLCGFLAEMYAPDGTSLVAQRTDGVIFSTSGIETPKHALSLVGRGPAE